MAHDRHCVAPRRLPLLRSLLLLNSLVLLASASQAQRWTAIAAKGPSARSDAVMTYDSARKQVVLFGGDAPSGFLNDTWTFDGIKWKRVVTSVQPSYHWRASLCFDEARGVAVYFGGTANGTNEVWEWNGTAWRKRSSASWPNRRQGAVLAYDSAQKRCVLFGGINGGDTWSYDGTSWTRLPATPLSATWASMAFDKARGRMVLIVSSRTNFATYELIGTDWKKITTRANPGPRLGSKLAFDSRRQRIVMSGGSFIPTRRAKIWEYDGTDWFRYETLRNPGPVSDSHVSTDCPPIGGVLVQTHDGQRWSFGGTHASVAKFGNSCLGSSGSLSLSTETLPQLGSVLRLALRWTRNGAQTAWLVRAGAQATTLLPYRECGVLPPQFVIHTKPQGPLQRLDLPIPNVNALRGLVVSVQAGVIDPTLFPAVHLSDLVRARLD